LQRPRRKARQGRRRRLPPQPHTSSPAAGRPGGHRSGLDLAPEPGAEGHVGAGIEPGEEFGDLQEVVGVVRVPHDDIPPPGAREPRFSGLTTVAPRSWAIAAVRSSEESAMMISPSIGKHSLDLSDALADGRFFVERGKDDGESGGVHFLE